MKKILIFLAVNLLILSVLGQGITEDFETQAGSMWEDWEQEFVVGTTIWSTASVNHTLLMRTPNFPNGGAENALFYATNGDVTRLITPLINTEGLSNPVLEFFYTLAAGLGGAQDLLVVYYRSSAGGDWIPLKEYYDNVRIWTRERISLIGLPNQLQLAFEATGYSGNGVQLDDVSVLNFTGSVGAEVTFLTPHEGFSSQLDTEQISIRFKNTSSVPVTQPRFHVLHFLLDDDNQMQLRRSIFYTLPQTIQSLHEIEYTFEPKLDMSEKGEHVLTINVELPDISLSIEREMRIIHVDCSACAEIDENFRAEFFPPPCWTVHSLGDAPTRWERVVDIFTRTTPAVHRHSSQSNQEGWLITPQIAVPNTGNTVIEFMSRNNNSAYYQYNGVWVSTGNNQPETFVELHELTEYEISGVWKRIILPISQYAGQNIYLAFKYEGHDADDWYIDEVKVWDFTGVLDAEVLQTGMTPETGWHLPADAVVSVMIANKGQLPLSSFDMTLSVNGTQLATQHFHVSPPLESFQSRRFTFDQRIDVSALGDYNVSVSVILPEDVNQNNNTHTWLVTNFVPPDFTSVIVDPNRMTYTGGPVRPRSVNTLVNDRQLVYKSEFDWQIISGDIISGSSSGVRVGTVTLRVFGLGDFATVNPYFVTYEIQPAYPHINTVPPNELTARFGNRLGQVTGLPNNWLWLEPDKQLGPANTSSEETVYFRPANNPENYEVVTLKVVVHVVKETGATLPAPTPQGVTINSITVNSMESSTGQIVEYAVTQVNAPPITGWQTGVTFSNLTPNATHFVFARTQENDNYNQGLASQPLQIATEAPPAITSLGTLPGAKAGELYIFQIAATGSDLSWSQTTGYMPPGMTLTPMGEIRGTTNLPGEFLFTISVSNIAGNHQREFFLVVTQNQGASVEAPILDFVTNNSIAIHAVPPPDNGQIVEYAISRTDEAPETGWATTLNFTGLIGNETYFIFARTRETMAFSVGPVSQSLRATTVSLFNITTWHELPPARFGDNYNLTLQSTGEPPIEWSIISGDLADSGLELSADGTISGIPTKTGRYTFEVRAQKAADNNTSASFTLDVEKGVGAVVSSPEIENVTYSSITVLPQNPPATGQEIEYSVNTITQPRFWQTELIFNDIEPSTTYYVFARAKENENYFAGPNSPSTYVTTPISPNPVTSTNELQNVDSSLSAWINDEGFLNVKGLSPGKQWSVYNVTGALVYRGIATVREENIKITDKGMYIIESENKTIRVVID